MNIIHSGPNPFTCSSGLLCKMVGEKTRLLLVITSTYLKYLGTYLDDGSFKEKFHFTTYAKTNIEDV